MLHFRIDPTVEMLRRKPKKSTKEKIRSPRYMLNNEKSQIPADAPIWTLNRAALRHLNWEDKEIPIYDPESDDGDDDNNDDNDNNAETSRSGRKRKRKEKKNKKSKKSKKK